MLTLTLTTVALALLSQGSDAPSPERRYSAEFERGLAALSRGEREVAAEAFGAAGTLAPDAPLWRLYLAAARGEVTTPPKLAPSAGGTWRLLTDLERGWPRFSPDGAHLLTGFNSRVCIWDAASGARVADVALSEGTEDLCCWCAERSGRYVFGTRIARDDFERLETLEVRRLATGELACPPLRIGERVARGTSLIWSDTPFDESQAVGDGPWFLVRRVALDAGTLTAFIPRRGTVDDPNMRAVLRGDGRRAVITYTEYTGGTPRSTGLLVAPDEPEPVSSANAEWDQPEFSRDGTLVVIGKWSGPVQVFDAETGAALSVPPELESRPGPDGVDWLPVVADAGALSVASHELVRTWDPRAGEWVGEVALSPPLNDLPWGENDRPESISLSRARVTAFGNYQCIAAYDADTGARLWWRRTVGVRWWPEAWHESPAGSWILLAGPDGAPLVVDARTGARAFPLRVGATAATSVTPFAYEVARADESAGEAETREAALVAAADGTLRTFELASGAPLGRAELHRGRAVVGVHVDVTGEVAFPAAVSWDTAGRVASWALPSLALQAQLEVEPGATVRAASVSAGTVVLARAEVDGVTPIELRQIDGGALVASAQVQSLAWVWLSDDSRRVALVGAPDLFVLDMRTGEVQAKIALASPPLGEYDGECAFHGPTYFALSWGSEGDLETESGVGLDVYDLTTGALAGRHHEQGFGHESWIGDVESMLELGRIAYSVNGSGVVFLLEDKTWTKVARIGSSSTLELSHTPGSERLFVSGNAWDHGRAFGARALERRAQDELAGLCGLRESASGHHVVGLGEGRVHVLHGTTLERQYERQELTGPGSRIVRAGKALVNRGVGPTATQDCHIERNGTSHPLACFDAWLTDPLELADMTLEHLPQPPRIDSGPVRTVPSDAASVTLRFRAEDELGLLGAWVVAAGRAPRFLTVDDVEQSKRDVGDFVVTLDGPWPLDVELLAVGRTGLESKPWRVRIEATE